MKLVTFAMGSSLDGYMAGPAGGFDWSVPDAELFRHHIDDLRGTAVQIMGRRLYETMLYWETAEGLDDDEVVWAEMWKALPKVVLSATLESVEGTNTELSTLSLADEVARWKAEPGDGDIAIGGAELAALAAAEDLIDEYRPTIHPVLVGGGRPMYAQAEREVGLELVWSRVFDNGVIAARYRVARG